MRRRRAHTNPDLFSKALLKDIEAESSCSCCCSPCKIRELFLGFPSQPRSVYHINPGSQARISYVHYFSNTDLFKIPYAFSLLESGPKEPAF